MQKTDAGARLVPIFFASLSSLLAQTKPLKEVRVPYALGGSTGFFWVAHAPDRSKSTA